MITRRVRFYILTIAMAGLQAGCSPSVIQVGQSPGKMLRYPDAGIGKKICLLPIILQYDLAGRYEEPTSDSSSQDAFSQEIETLSRKYLEQGGFEVIQLKDLPTESRPAAEKEWSEIRSHRKDLLNQFRSKDSARESLSRIGQLAEVQTVVLVNVQICIGRSGDWNIITGEARPDESSTSIKAVILSCQDGHQYWANEVFMRKRPKMEMMGQAMNLLFCSKSDNAK